MYDLADFEIQTFLELQILFLFKQLYHYDDVSVNLNDCLIGLALRLIVPRMFNISETAGDVFSACRLFRSSSLCF